MFADATMLDSNIAGWNVSGAMTLHLMFALASSFQQDLCPWGSHLSFSADVAMMLTSQAVRDQQGDPNLAGAPPGPFCFACN